MSDNFHKVLKMNFTEIICYPIGIIIVVCIRILSSILLIKFSPIRSSRIGHFAGNTELACLEIKELSKKNIKKEVVFFYFKDKTICNKFLAKMWCRTITVVPRDIAKAVVFLNRFFKGYEKFEFHPKCNDRDIYNLLDSNPPILEFTPLEIQYGFDQLKQMGVPKNSKYVCLIVRDSAYLNSEDYSYHNYRNCDIDNYKLAADWLTKEGYFVIRMGSKVEREFKTNNTMIFDYATNGYRSEFLDIFISANCTFAISTSTGLDAISILFRKPIVFAPFVPLAFIFTFSSKFIAITKHHFSILENRNLTLSEIFQFGLSGCLKTDDFTKKGVVLIENTPEEIRAVVEEMHGILNNKLSIDNLSNLFWSKYSYLLIQNQYSNLHGEIKATFSPIFLKNNKYLISN